MSTTEPSSNSGGDHALPTVGFIGLGIMGRPMARNVLAAGYKLVVYDLMAVAVNELVDAGATAANSPAGVAVAADVVLLLNGS